MLIHYLIFWIILFKGLTKTLIYSSNPKVKGTSADVRAKAGTVAGLATMIVGGVFAAAGGSMNLADGTDSNPASDYLTTMGNIYNGLVAQPQ